MPLRRRGSISGRTAEGVKGRAVNNPKPETIENQILEFIVPWPEEDYEAMQLEKVYGAPGGVYEAL